MSDNDTWDTGRIGDFFEAGRAYTTQTGYLAPELEWNFACAAVTRTPAGERIAFGHVQTGTGDWTPTGFGRRDFSGHAWNPARPPEWLTVETPEQITVGAAPSSPLARAEDAKRRRDLGGEIAALTAGHDQLTSTPWHPSRPGDLVHVHYPAAGTAATFGETYVVGDADGGLMSLQLLAHTLPDDVEHTDGMVGCFAADAADEPLYEMWFEAGPHLLTIVRDGRPVHVGGAR